MITHTACGALTRSTPSIAAVDGLQLCVITIAHYGAMCLFAIESKRFLLTQSLESLQVKYQMKITCLTDRVDIEIETFEQSFF
jgi:hypothetical protein